MKLFKSEEDLKRVRKDISGSMSAVREFDIADTVQDCDPAAARDEQDYGSTRLGNQRVMNVVEMLPNLTRTFQTVGDTGTMRPDPFLHSDQPAYIGGVTKPGGDVRPTQGYIFDEPNADKRGDENFADDGTDSPIPGPANAQFPDAGRIGGRNPGTYVVKRADVKRPVAKGTFRSVIEDPSNLHGFSDGQGR